MQSHRGIGRDWRLYFMILTFPKDGSCWFQMGNSTLQKRGNSGKSIVFPFHDVVLFVCVCGRIQYNR